MAGEPPYRILVEDGGQIQGVAQVLIRKGAFGRQIAYVPHGPVWDRSAPNADRIFAWLAQGLRSLALKEKALVVKLDPRNEPGQDFDFRHLAAEHDLQPAQDLQAPTTRIVDLLDGGEAAGGLVACGREAPVEARRPRGDGGHDLARAG